ncbi:membrane integrity-associated transporter subunit PqiC [Sulfurimonas sp. SAG-AH-194-I05]|nr:ABC-type transport auxiliary lipoprotein family protein [Sulfurimonas sp. SAG-AH-194-I05]MDF1875528.1 membrane integrity-associated transporter subunit PqiC [Sulfurimonas sp. SAG-AH-194-I05]
MYYIFSFIIPLLFSGCIVTKIPQKTEYKLSSSITINDTETNRCKEKSLKIANAFSVASLLTRNMKYSIGSSKQYTYSKSKWSLSPNRAITASLLTLIRDSQIFKNVQIAKSRSRSDYIMEINIEDFMQYFNENSSSSHAKIRMNITLVEVRTRKVFASETFSSHVDIKELNANGGVQGLSQALDNILSQSNNWLIKVCK